MRHGLSYSLFATRICSQTLLRCTNEIHLGLAIAIWCANFPISIAIWLTRRWGLHNGRCPNLCRGDRVLNLLPSDCKSGLLQPLDHSSRADCAEHSFHLWMSLDIFDIILIITNINRLSFMTSPPGMAIGPSWRYIYRDVFMLKWRFIYKFLTVYPFDCIAVAGSWPVSLSLTTPVRWMLSLCTADHSKYVRNRRVIERFVVSLCYFDYALSVIKGCCHTTASDLFPLLLILSLVYHDCLNPSLCVRFKRKPENTVHN